jgi:hypothetical protein
MTAKAKCQGDSNFQVDADARAFLEAEGDVCGWIEGTLQAESANVIEIETDAGTKLELHSNGRGEIVSKGRTTCKAKADALLKGKGGADFGNELEGKCKTEWMT